MEDKTKESTKGIAILSKKIALELQYSSELEHTNLCDMWDSIAKGYMSLGLAIYNFGKNDELVFKYCNDFSAEMSNPGGKMLLGLCYENGIGTKVDKKRALELYNEVLALIKEKFEEEHDFHLIDLYKVCVKKICECYHKGIGTDVDESKVLKTQEIMEKVARKLYLKGKQILKKNKYDEHDGEDAAKLIFISAELGCCDAQYMLGEQFKYSSDENLKRQSAKYLETVGNNTYVENTEHYFDIEYELSWSYYKKGEYEQAVYHMEQAAQGGKCDAKYFAGLLNKLVREYEKSYKWFKEVTEDLNFDEFEHKGDTFYEIGMSPCTTNHLERDINFLKAAKEETVEALVELALRSRYLDIYDDNYDEESYDEYMERAYVIDDEKAIEYKNDREEMFVKVYNEMMEKMESMCERYCGMSMDVAKSILDRNEIERVLYRI